MNLILKGNPVLKQTAVEVQKNEMVSATISLMWAVMTQHRGIGLAANQIGVLQRIIVVHAGSFKQEIINPVITKGYRGKTTQREGCLSFPGYTVPVIRDKQIIVEGFDRNWKPIKRKLKGLAAYCVQHEVDHLNGITIEDKQ